MVRGRVPLSKILIFLVLLLFHILLEKFMQKQNGFGLLLFYRLTTVCFLMFLSRRRPNMARTSVLTYDYPLTLRLQPPGSPGLIPRPARVRWILSPSRVLIRKYFPSKFKSFEKEKLLEYCYPIGPWQVIVRVNSLWSQLLGLPILFLFCCITTYHPIHTTVLTLV